MNLSHIAIQAYPMIPEIAILMGALSCLLADLFIKEDSYRISSYIALASIVFALYALFIFDSGEISVLGGLFTLSMKSMPFKFLILLCTFVVLAISDSYLHSKNAHYGEYHFIVLLASLSFMLVVSSDNLVLIFFALEMASLCAYVLCGLRRTSIESTESAMKYFIIGSLAAAILLYGISFIFRGAGSMNLETIFTAVQASSGNSMFMLGFLLVSLALCIKLAIAPFHWWSPDVYKGAPTPVVAYLSTVTKIGSLFLLVKIIIGIGSALPRLSILLESVAIFSILFGAIVAYRYKSLKSIMAMSSVNQFGYLILIVLLNKEDAVLDIYFYLAAYSLATIGVFGVFAILEQSTRHANGLTLDDLAGLGISNPKLSAALALFICSYAGVPLTSGFIAKLRILSSAVTSGSIAVVVTVLAGSLITLYYYLKIVIRLYQDKNPNIPVAVAPNGGVFMTTSYLGVGLSVILTVALGISPGFILVLGSLASY